MGVIFAHLNRRENRCSLAISDCGELTEHLGTSNHRDMFRGVVRFAAAAEERVILVHSAAD